MSYVSHMLTINARIINKWSFGGIDKNINLYKYSQSSCISDSPDVGSF